MRMLMLLALVGVACAASTRQSTRIIGGEATTIENYPFMSAILVQTFFGLMQSCGGTLVTSTSVVSAAHCFSGLTPSSLRVRLGSTFASSGGTVHTLSRIIMHQQYVASILLNDVAVIRLSNPAVFSNRIQIARIAGPRFVLQDNTRLLTAGWGVTTYQGWASETLQHVAVNVINHRLCTERYAYLKTLPGMSRWPDVTPEMLCTGILDVGGKDACQGDSGGPVIHGRDVLVGITSWGYECAHHFYPGVNARVSSYSDWIVNNSL